MSRGVSEVVVGATRGLPARRVREAVLHVLRAERRTARVELTFLGATRMRDLNRQYLGRDYITDVISFALPHPGEALAGDVYLCRVAAVRHAREHGVPVREELVRLVIHGTLHVLGYDHPEGASRVRSDMWRRQERYLQALR